VFSNLDRIQIIKGWIDDAGERQKRVYDVAVLGGYPSAAGESVTRRLRKFFCEAASPCQAQIRETPPFGQDLA
jgi:hypothetical protein